MSDIDDDEVGLDAGMEPESATGQAPAAVDDDDDGDGDDGMDVLPGGSVSAVATPRGIRPVSARVRELLAAIGKQAKTGDDDSGEDVAITGDMEPATGAAPKAPAAPGGGVAATAPPVAPPAASLDPEVGKLRESWAAKHAELDAREKALAAREVDSDFANLRELYLEKGSPAIAKVVAMLTGLSGDELKTELADLVTDMSAQELSVDVPQEIRQRLDTKRAHRSIKAMKDDLAKREAASAKAKETATENEKRTYAVHLLKEEMKKPDVAKLYPHLAVEEDPGTLIVEVVERQLAKDGTQMTWEQAAKRVNDYLNTQASAWFDKRKHLLSAASGTGGGEQRKGTATRETAQGQRRSQPAEAQPVSPPVAPAIKNGKYDPEAHRRATKHKVRGLFAQRPDE